MKSVIAFSKIVKFCGYAIIIAFISYFGIKKCTFYYKKYVVMNTPEAELQKWGKYFVVGYQDTQEIEALIQKGAVGGVYLSHKNIAGKKFVDVQDMIARWQMLQKKSHRTKLVITADQEGGNVSHLSPMLPNSPALSTLVNDYKKAQIDKIHSHASSQAQDMQSLGLTLNLAPVVDLQDKSSLSLFDLGSRIYERSISDDPHIVGEIAGIYCQELEKFGIQATLKHFPGLGSARGDTHFYDVVVKRSLADYKTKDWLPYQTVFSSCKPAVMLSHVVVSSLDDQLPASLSAKVIQDVLRNELKFKGLVITDDFSMAPISRRKGGVGKASRLALKAGVDLILISHKPDLYYEAMYELLKQPT